MASSIHSITPKLFDIKSALLNSGFKVSISHTFPQSIKTNAPVKIVWSIFICWVAHKSPEYDLNHKNDIIKNIFKINEQMESSGWSFLKNPNATPDSIKNNLCRFQENPTKNWGPLSRAKPENKKEK